MNEHSGSLKTPDVRPLLQQGSEAVRGPLPAPVHGHSLLLEIETEDVYKDMTQNQGLFDTSDYPEDYPLYNNKVLGKLKDECAGRAIADYAGLGPEMYSVLEASGSRIKKAKGVKRPP